MGDETLLDLILKGEKEPDVLPLALLQRITDNFSQENQIGQGGFGVVYKGVLPNGIIVAVKRINVNVITIDDVSFRGEIKSLMKTNHQNVVRFLGFCSSNTHHILTKDIGSSTIDFVNVRERLLCLEYINNGSLDKHITDELRGLEWETRYDIIFGICMGLHHLHEEKHIIHMDLKPPNILLNEHMIPKITDFGLARSNRNSHTIGERFGTRGYVAPEYEKDGKTSFKCDIYSLGVIIIELVSGCKSVPQKNNVLRRWRHRWKKPLTSLQYQQLTRCIEIARHCRQQNPEARPSISEIISLLNKSERADGLTGEESSYPDDDMLGIEPLKLHFTLKSNKEISCFVKLTNKTKACFAFNIERPSELYTIRQNKGIVKPECKKIVRIIMQPQATTPQVTHNGDKFIVKSTKVSKDLRVNDITKNIFREEASKVVDEVNLMVVYEPAGSLKRGLDPNVPVKDVNSSSYEHGARRRRDRCNFHPPENFSRCQPTNKTYLLRVSDRAIDVTRGAMGSLLHKLGELLKYEFNLEKSVKKDVQFLSEELKKMQHVLRKVQQDNLEDDLVKHWASNVRDMSYDLEDFVDGFLVHNDPDSNTSGFKELTHEMCFLLEKGKSHQLIGDLIKEHISNKVQDAAKKCKEYMVENVVPNATAKAAIEELRIPANSGHNALLVGIETRRDELIRLIKEDGNVSKQHLKIVSIVGLGGLGKTTLAKAVYDELKAQFNPKTFVSLGQNPDVKKVLEKLFRKIVDENFNEINFDVDELIEKLQESLKDKRYFIVVDDIWDSEAWGLITSAFPRNNHGSRVITTTRNELVARACCEDESKYVYRMKPLSEEDSRSLFLRRIFGPGKDCPDAQKGMSTDILKRCSGMPLAINSIASLLAGDESGSNWEYVWKSLGSLTKGDDVKNMKKILDLSYIYLPDHLKTCLVHVCMYPEDHEIDKNDLTRQWVAEGFVVSTNGRLDAEEVAETYFKELINMCMIQPGRIDEYSNEVMSCTVQDIILDLMRSKSSEENFIHVIDGSKDKTSAHRAIRRISVHGNEEVDNSIFETINEPLLHVRSALFYKVSPVPYLLAFKYVRVLHIEYTCYLVDLDLTGITRLFMLRYLKIKNSYGMLKLPGQIKELQQLETIDFGGSSFETHPSDIGSLPWLSHLKYDTFSDNGIALPEGVERLKFLHTLEGVHLYESSPENIKGIGKLTSLRKLHIFLEDFKQSEEEATAMRMNALQSSISMISASLRILTFGAEELEDDRESVLDVPRGWSSKPLFREGSAIVELDLGCCRFERCPQWISQLRNLHKFSVIVREVADAISIVAWLPSLSYFNLEIRCDEEEKEESVVIPGGGSFKALKYLNYGCPKAALTFEAGAMPKLEKLDLRLEKLPIGIQHLPAPTLNKICLFLYNADLNEYMDSDLCTENHKRKLWVMLKKAFKQHHPGASIDVYVSWHHPDYSDDEYYSTEEDDEPAYQVNRQIVELIELWKDSDGMSIGSEGSQSGRGEDFCEDDDKEDRNSTVLEETTSCNISTLLDVSIEDIGEVRERGGAISASLDAKRPLITEASAEYAAKQSSGQERDGNNIVLEETISSNISTLFDASIEDVDKVRETVGLISASPGAERQIITEASAEYAVNQSGTQERDGNNTVLEEATSSNVSTLFDVSIEDLGEAGETAGAISASLDAKRPLITEASTEYAAKQSGGQERDGNNIVLEETSSNISTLVDALIEDVGEVREMGDPISASLGAKRPLITEASAECAVEQSGAQDRDRNNTVLEKSRILTSSNISTLLDGSVSASLGAMRALVGKLDVLLLAPPQGCSSESVKDGMQFLREDVEEISSYLDELSEVEEPPPTAKCWMNDALDLSCDIEDYIDGLLFVQPAQPSKNVKGTRSRLRLSGHAKAPKRLKPRHEQIAERVSEFSMFIKKAIERHQRYDLHSFSALRRRFMPLGPMLPMRYEETAVTVIDGRMNKFINSLANDDGKQIKVMSVLGCSGLGKTTLARALYNEVGKRFQYRAFIRVSEQPDTRRIFRDMLFQLERRHPTPDCKETDLIDNINTYLQDKRYLIILDDVCDASVWDIINQAFPKGSHGSRIITTTQVEDVALTCCCYQSEHIFQMKPLDGDHSRKLFFNILFGSESNCPEQFKGDLNKIVEICGGLPLVTISIASLIASQPAMTKDVLKHIHESLSSHFLEKSISERTRQALNLSFNNLPQYLKSCLLYLSMCPEGYEFFKYDLVKQWVAEGLIDITEGQDITKVAESYLDQLIGRRFIQPISISYNNEVVSCAVHDAIHDFIVHKSAEENFIVAINHNQNKVSLSHMVRRLSLLFGDARYAKTPVNISKPQIRSLRFSGLFECMPCIRDFKLLRVLNLHLSGNPGDHDSIDLTRISELFLLRYLKIACDFCIELPKAMGELRCLETLDLMDATRVTAFPWDIIHLPHLLHLALPVERNLLDWIGSMGDSIISLWNLGKLNNLHDLHLTSSCTQPLSDHLERSMEALGALLGGHGNLKTLALTHDDRSWYKDASRVIIFWDGLTPPPLLQRFEFSPHSCITFSRVPQWVKELGNLCILKITVRELQMHCVDILRGLPALTALSLYVETSPIDEIIFGNHGFSVLKYFKFRCSAPWLKFEAGAMPTLGKLMLGFNAIPAMDQHQHGNALISIEHMPGLKEISAKIGGVTANADAISALRTVISNHQSNPTINVQLVDFTFYGHESTKQKQQQDEVVGLPVGETN